MYQIQYHGLISSKVAVGDNKGAYRIFKVAILVFGLIGFAGTTILFLSANIIANTYLGIPEAELTIKSLAPSVFIVAVSSVLRGYFNGKEQISVTANSQSIEQILKTIMTVISVEIFAIISRKNTVIMVSGVAVATTAATFLSFIYLYISYIKNKKAIWKDVLSSTLHHKESIFKIIRNIICVSLPIALTALLSSSNRTVDAFTVVNTISKFMGLEDAKLQYGILTGKVETLVTLPYSFNIAFSISLIPSISAAKARGEMDKALKRVNFSMLATILISLPCTAVLFFFAEPILKLLFPNAYLGKTMLQLCSLSIVFVAMAQTIGGVLQGLRKLKEPAIAIGVGAVIKLILNIMLVPVQKLNINGAIISTIISHIVTFGIMFCYLKKNISIVCNVTKFIIKPIIATIIMIITSLSIYNNIELFSSNNINLIFSLMIGMVVYVIAIIILRVLSKEEINMLPYGNKLYIRK